MKEGKKAFWITSGITHGILLTVVCYGLVLCLAFMAFKIVTVKPPIPKPAFLPKAKKETIAIKIAQENNPTITLKNLTKNLKGDIQITGWLAILAENQGLKFDWVSISNDQAKEAKELIEDILKCIKLMDNNTTKIWLASDIYLPLIEAPINDINRNEVIYNYTAWILSQKNELIKQEGGTDIKILLDRLNGLLSKLNDITGKYEFNYNDNLYYVSFTWADMKNRALGYSMGNFYEVNVKENTCRPIIGDAVLSKKYEIGNNNASRDAFNNFYGNITATLSYWEFKKVTGGIRK